jgi:hypothetical protein
MAKETIRNASVFRPALNNRVTLVPVGKLEGKAVRGNPATCLQAMTMMFVDGPWARFAAGLRRSAAPLSRRPALIAT